MNISIGEVVIIDFEDPEESLTAEQVREYYEDHEDFRPVAWDVLGTTQEIFEKTSGEARHELYLLVAELENQEGFLKNMRKAQKIVEKMYEKRRLEVCKRASTLLCGTEAEDRS